MNKRLLVLICTTAAQMTACAHGEWAKSSDGYEMIETKHVRFITDTSIKINEVIKGFENGYAIATSTLFRKTTRKKFDVLYLRQSEFVALFGVHRLGVAIGEIPGRAGTLGNNGLIVVHEGVFTTAVRLMAHLFAQEMSPDLPLWERLGFSEYLQLANLRYGGSTQAICLGLLGGRQPWVSADELFSANWDDVDRSRKYEWYVFSARSVFDYFISGNEDNGREKFFSVINRTSGGASSKEAFAMEFPASRDNLAPLFDRIKDYRRRSEQTMRDVCPMQFPVSDENRADTTRIGQTPVAASDMAALFSRLGMLPRRDGYIEWYPSGISGLGQRGGNLR